MKFSKKHPLSMKIINKEDDFIKSVHQNAYEKIKQYKDILKNDKDMTPELKAEIILAIKKYRGQIRFNKSNKKFLDLRYKNAQLIVDISNNTIDPKKFNAYKSKLKNILIQKRKSSKKRYKEIRKIDNEYYEIDGGVHTKNNTIFDLFYKVARKRVNSYRKPTDSENNIGAEIEFFSSYSRDDIVNRLIEAKLSPYVRIMTDGSIRASEEKPGGLELCVVSPESKYLVIFERVCDLLSDIGAETNPSCGFHVHLDCRNRNRDLLYNNLVKCQNILFGLVHPSRRDNQYCRPQVSSEWEKSRNHHYDAISTTSFEKHKTVEVRIHHGTVSFPDIKNWLTLLIKIANYTNFMDKANKVDNLKKLLDIDNQLYGYIQEKTALFS